MGGPNVNDPPRLEGTAMRSGRQRCDWDWARCSSCLGALGNERGVPRLYGAAPAMMRHTSRGAQSVLWGSEDG